MTSLTLSFCQARLDLEQARDLRRSVLCGELGWPREVVNDPADAQGQVALGLLGPKPVATARLAQRQGEWTIEAMAVLPAFRGKGIGRSLIETLELRARALGVLRLSLLCPESAQAYFERFAYFGMESQEAGLPQGWRMMQKPLK